jgi:presenilin 1
LDIEDVLYSANSFWAVLKPVALTMFLASVVVVYVEFATEDQGVSVYAINDGDADGNGGDSNSVKLGKSLINALTIVGVICGATFVVVLLYKFRCMKCLFGYMAFSSTMLLGLMGGLLWYTALARWDLPCDYLTFVAVLYNFAFVGVAAIFYQKGIPTWVTQGYLVMISVIMAWQLSRFEEWTGWALLVVLALYDLCAVLTPCGPLKYLVGLMQERDAPTMPGLLYEAELPAHARHHHRVPPPLGGRGGGGGGGGTASATEGMDLQTPVRDVSSDDGGPVALVPSSLASSLHSTSPPSPLDPLLDGSHGSPGGTHLDHHHRQQQQQQQQLRGGRVDARLLEAGGALREEEEEGERGSGGVGGRSGVGDNPSSLSSSSQQQHHGEGEGGAPEERSIKLGLGDFVFYSVLVGKAALYGFATCAACFLVIISGLGATLVLLSVFRKALPALPISIGLGVLFYLLTRVAIIPYIDALVASPIYV